MDMADADQAAAECGVFGASCQPRPANPEGEAIEPLRGTAGLGRDARMA